MKYSWIYSDKYGDEIEKYLEENISMKKNVKSRIFNEEFTFSLIFLGEKCTLYLFIRLADKWVTTWEYGNNL